MKPVFGLIGGIGSGKSWVAEELARRGARVISGDELGHEALRQPALKAAIVRRWGKEIVGPDGEIIRSRVAGIVFADPAERRALESIVFPWMETRFQQELAAAEKDPRVTLVVLDAAIMLEAGWDRYCDRLIFVDAPEEVRRARLAAQRGWDAAELAKREQAQMPLAQKRARADAVLHNAGSRAELSTEITRLLERWHASSSLPAD